MAELNSLNGENITNLFLRRDETAISECQNTYGKLLLKISFNILNNHEDSEECLNDTLIKAWNSIPPTVPEILSAYLSKIIRNISINRFHSIHAKKRDFGAYILIDELASCLPSKATLDEEIDKKNLSDLLNAFLKSLKSEERILFIRRYFFGDDLKTLASESETTEKIISSKLFRTRAKLKATLERNGVFL